MSRYGQKNKYSILACFFTLLLFSGCASHELKQNYQKQNREKTNHVFSFSASNDGTHVGSPYVIFDGIYKMWYFESARDDTRRIGYATSLDGKKWQRYKGNNCTTRPSSPGCVLDIGSSSSWDGNQVYGMSVLIDPGAPVSEKYKMWYTGVDNNPSFQKQKWRTGYATSPDGIIWKKYQGNTCGTHTNGDGCVFDTGSPGHWDDDVVAAPSVIIDAYALPSERFKMWYEGCVYNKGEPRHICRIGYATSPDGIRWKKYPVNNCSAFPHGHGCVLDTGKPGDWDDIQVIQPLVLKLSNETYEMWYAGTYAGNLTTRIGKATSGNGIEWTRHPDNRCPSNSSGSGCVFDIGEWLEYSAVMDPQIIINDKDLMLWYSRKAGTGLVFIENFLLPPAQ